MAYMKIAYEKAMVQYQHGDESAAEDFIKEAREYRKNTKSLLDQARILAGMTEKAAEEAKELTE